ncbi:MAG: M15 family metallopeptidase [Deltaproteobacteria bacterium]|nr:M15 family metallopeptidase [Deltaproteobacteria bacterium]
MASFSRPRAAAARAPQQDTSAHDTTAAAPHAQNVTGPQRDPSSVPAAELAGSAHGGLLDELINDAGALWDWVFGDEEGAQEVTPTSAEDRTETTDAPRCAGDGAPPPPLEEVAWVTVADLEAHYKNNPRALAALKSLTADPGVQKLPPGQLGGLLARFMEAPNLATMTMLKGLAAYHTSDDPCGAGLAAWEDGLRPDGGTLKRDGVTYTIRDGALLDASGVEVGQITNDGQVKMSGEEQATSVYDELHAGVELTETDGENNTTLLTLHDADPAGKLADPNMNDTFTAMASETLRDVRREGMDMRVGDANRTFAEQQGLYDQHNGVTNAQAGEGWHNYGLAADLVFCDKNGGQSWPNTGEHTKLWTRLGELAEENGLDWGGRWKKKPDRPHVEYHPGLGPSDAKTMKDEMKAGGYEAVWDTMGIREIP